MIEALRPFVGVWRGEGRGGYPTVDDFAYREEIALVDVGKPWLSYSSRTWALGDGRALHWEGGFWREGPGGAVEAVLALTTGHVEIDAGYVRDARLELTSSLYARTPTAKDVTEVRRLYEVDGDGLRYTLEMAALGQPLVWHLTATLDRVRT